MTSPGLTETNIEKLIELFPTALTESVDFDGNVKNSIDFDMLRQELSDHIVDGPQERYRLDWPGKRAAAFAANAPIAKTLRPVREESVNFDTTKNLFIEGDNLEVLKVLQESYLGKVKMIYIDPPYNTAGNLLYEDDFATSTSDYLDRSGQSTDEGMRLVTNNDTNGRFHSDWLSMMYPRLKLARNLLTTDGVVFISIDDNELRNLWILCSEVFGAQNAVACLPRRTKAGGGSAAHHFAIEHDYVLVFARDKAALGPMFVPHDPEYTKRYAEEDAHGKYFWDTMERSSTATRPYVIVAPDGSDLRGKWFRSEERFLKDLESGEVRFLRKPDMTWSVQFKQRLAEGKRARSLMVENEFRATPAELEILGLDRAFPFPKPVHLIEHLLAAASSKNDIILDFFAGSGTTGHAVMNQNVRDGGTRKFILVQLPETCAPDSIAAEMGFATISELARERIKRAGGLLASQSEMALRDLDIGYRALKVDTTNMTDVFRTPGSIDQLELDEVTRSVKQDRSGEDLVFQVILDWGLQLTMPISTEWLDGKTIFIVEDGALIACFDEHVTMEVVQSIANRRPLRAVFRDSGFASDDARINAEQVFREVSPATDVMAI